MTAAPLLAALALLAPPGGSPGEPLTPGEWPMFRGPNGSGIGADPLPADLIREENLVWRVDVPGRGWASPVVADGPGGKTIYVATAEADGTTQSVLAYDLATGERRWNCVLFLNESPDFCHPTNTYASCTPLATAGAVFAHFGKYGTARLDPADGHTVWERRDLKCDHFRGPASSPLLVQGEGVTPRLVIPFDGIDEQYVVALDAATGETRWRYDRPGLDELIPDKRKAYGTPVLCDNPNSYPPFDRTRFVVTTGAAETVGLDPANGAVLWRNDHGGMNSGVVPQLLLGSGSKYTGIVTATGDGPTELVQLNLFADETSSHATDGRSVPRRSSPLVVGMRGLFTVDDDGVAALRIAAGPPDARMRLNDSFWSSPVFARNYKDGQLGGTAFIFGKGGLATSFRFDRNGFDRLSPEQETTLDDGVWATPALAGGGLVLRTEHTLRFYKPGGTTE